MIPKYYFGKFYMHISLSCGKNPLAILSLGITSASCLASQTDIVGPPDSVAFGAQIAALPNGNIVVTDPYHPAGGAVYLYSRSGALLSTLTGGNNTQASGLTAITITVLKNGNYVIVSPQWSNGSTPNVGAVTFARGDVGLAGEVSPQNSLVGTQEMDQVGLNGVIALENGNYLVRNSYWRYGNLERAGAVTWGDGNTGASGPVSVSNSLVGTRTNESVGFWPVQGLANGNYVVVSRSSNACGIGYCGAIVWGDGDIGITGEISISNALVGPESPGLLGVGRIVTLPDGDALVLSPMAWANGLPQVGAVTRIDSEKGIVGVISSANSLMGTKAFDQAGIGGVSVLMDGGYVVVSPEWSNEQGTSVGAVTWFAADAQTQGEIDELNSLVGSSPGDRVGSAGVAALSNGHFTIASPDWDHADITDAGAVTWASGLTGINGHISDSNSVIGSSDHQIGAGGVTPLTDGNYVISSPAWHTPGTMLVGAATWVNGDGPSSFVVSANNSLTGATSEDAVGAFGGVVALPGGDYVVASPQWDNGSATNAGAVTWVPGSQPFSGIVSAENSLVGTSEFDFVGSGGVVPLGATHYAVNSRGWANGPSSSAGAVTILTAATPLSGMINVSNSIVGTTSGDQVGRDGVMSVGKGEYVIGNPYWDNQKMPDAGAYLLGREVVSGVLKDTTSVLGTEPYGGFSQEGAGNVYTYDEPRRRMIVGRYSSNTVSILTFTPDTLLHGSFEIRPPCPEVSLACL